MRRRPITLTIMVPLALLGCGGGVDSSTAALGAVSLSDGSRFSDSGFDDDELHDVDTRSFDAKFANGGAASGVDADALPATYGGELPDEFPLPLPDDSRLIDASVVESSGGPHHVAVVAAPIDDFEAIDAMYQSYLEDEGFEVSRSVGGSDDAPVVVIDGHRDGVTVGVTVERTPTGDQGDESSTLVSLSWAPDD